MSDHAPDICIYHANCDDGFAAAYAVWKRFGDGVKFVPAQYGGDIPDVAGKDVLIVDFSFKQPEMQRLADEAKRIIVLDHHKTAEAELTSFTRMECVGGPFEKRYADRLISGVGVCFDMNKSGCRLAWEYCFGDEPMPDWFAAVEDRDLWRFALPATKEICISIRSHPRDFQIWDGFDAGELATEGAAIRRYVDMIVSNICDTAFVENIGGHDVPVAACSYDFVSETANQLLQRNPDAPFAACMVRSYDGLTYSLRSMDDRMDVSEIAKANGGGGHRNAAGFRAKANPSPQPNLEGDEIAKLTADRNLYKGKYRSIVALMNDTRQKVQEIVDHIEDEGDRTYFGSSNHADWLRDLVDDMDGWSFDAMLPKGDINKMERDPYADCRQLRWALKLAIEHIEHMAAFIGPLKAGYSFESLGEDMPEIKAALSPLKSEQRS